MKIIFALYSLAFLLFRPPLVSADALPPGMKQIDSFTKIEGWDTVSDYYLVVPGSSWAECDNSGTDQRPFRLLNSGRTCDLTGQIGDYCNEATEIYAIPKTYEGDFAPYPTIDDFYAISCSSPAYTQAIPLELSAPFRNKGADLVPESSKRIQTDFVITLAGIDPIAQKLNYTVSKPIERLENDTLAAQAFEASFGVDQKPPTVKISPSPTPSNPVPSTQTQNRVMPEKNEMNRNRTNPGSVWSVLAGTSLFLSGGLIGYGLGLRTSKRETTADDLSHPSSTQ